MRLELLLCRARRASRQRRLVVISVQAHGDRIDESLVVAFAFTRCDCGRLSVCFGDELRSADIRHPDLHRAQSLAAQTLAVLTDPVTG